MKKYKKINMCKVPLYFVKPAKCICPPPPPPPQPH